MPICQLEDIGWSFDPAQIIKQVKLARAQTVNIQRLARDKMFQFLTLLGLTTEPAGTAAHRLSFWSVCRMTTDRTGIRKHKRLTGPAAFILDHFDDLGDHITCTLQHNMVTNADIFTCDFIFIM